MNNGKLRIPPSLFKPIECVQHGGQVLYIPDHWWHMVLNIDETVGITVQSNGPGYTVWDLANGRNEIVYGNKKW